MPGVTLPKGGGAIRGIGEKFSVSPVTGTSSLSVPPFALSAGRAGFTPSLELAYDSGSGNGPFGFGWKLPLPAITRRTDRGLPRYLDAEESDTFLLTGAEDLVPVLDASGARVSSSRTVNGVAYTISQYRPRIEGLFSRIERWVNTATGISHWRSISSGNITALYGYDSSSCVADPANPKKIFTLFDFAKLGRSGQRGGLRISSGRYDRSRSGGSMKRIAHMRRFARQGDISRPYGTEIYRRIFPNGLKTARRRRCLRTGCFRSCSIMAIIRKRLDDCAGSTLGAASRSRFRRIGAGFEVRTYRRVERVLYFHNFHGRENDGSERAGSLD